MNQQEQISIPHSQQDQNLDSCPRGRGLRKKKTKNYRNFCQKHHSTVQKRTRIIHNTFVFSFGPDGLLQKTFHQKIRERKSKETSVKEHKMRKETHDFNTEIEKMLKAERLPAVGQGQEVKMEASQSMPYQTFGNFIPFVPLLQNQNIIYQN